MGIHDLLASLKTLLPNLSRLFCTLWSTVKFILRKDSRLMVHLFLLPEIWAYSETVGFPLQHPPLQLAYSSQHLLAILSWQVFCKEADCKNYTCCPKTHACKKIVGVLWVQTNTPQLFFFAWKTQWLVPLKSQSADIDVLLQKFSFCCFSALGAHVTSWQHAHPDELQQLHRSK